VIGALVAAGLRVANVQVRADGSFCVEVADIPATVAKEFEGEHSVREDEAPSWDDVDA
jgi:hypothetical protein